MPPPMTPAAPKPAAGPSDEGGVQNDYDSAILDEIELMLDFVAGSPDRTLHDLKFVSHKDPTKIMPVKDVLAELDSIREALKPGRPVLPETDRSFLLLVRDALNTLIRPASGLTVAYTAMVVGNRRRQDMKSRAVKAGLAYTGLRGKARWHRVGHGALLLMALVLTATATWDSARVALGKSLIQTMQELRVKQAEISKEKVRVAEALSGSAGSATLQLFTVGSAVPEGARLMLRVCDRPKLLGLKLAEALPQQAQPAEATQVSDRPNRVPKPTPVFESAAQQDVCDRDEVLAYSFLLAHTAINHYWKDWSEMVGSPFDSLGLIVSSACGWLKIGCDRPASSSRNPVTNGNDEDAADTELMVAPVLIVLGNYVLPVIFALLGAAAFVILDFYGKMRTSMLAPRDHVLSWIRLVLGSVIGACIGLFFSSQSPPPQGQADLLGALTLSASGVAFLAGFGVEGVFAALGTVVKRVFPSETN